jgi:hypothetical protein
MAEGDSMGVPAKPSARKQLLSGLWLVLGVGALGLVVHLWGLRDGPGCGTQADKQHFASFRHCYHVKLRRRVQHQVYILSAERILGHAKAVLEASALDQVSVEGDRALATSSKQKGLTCVVQVVQAHAGAPPIDGSPGMGARVEVACAGVGFPGFAGRGAIEKEIFYGLAPAEYEVAKAEVTKACHDELAEDDTVGRHGGT